MKICPVCSTEYADDVKFCPNDGQTLRAAAPATDLVGQVVADRYHVIKKLGEGGMGQVYLAEHVKMGRRSAIKVMNPSLVHDPDAVARFNREAANASRISHVNVCAIYDFGETPDGLIYLAMEFIEGEPLTDLLEREGALSVPRAVHIFTQVADALQAAHDLGIVHRDLKPDNIMLTHRKDGTDGVKVVDFGIAKAVGGDESGQKVTKTGLVVGTPEFMSPEQLSGDKIDGRSDAYSLALVFFRMLTGKLPFDAATVQETMIKRLTDEPQHLAQTRPDLTFPAGLQAVLDTALARSPADRYQTAAKFAADVAAVTGAGRGHTPVPRTRADRADSEGKTQLLDTTTQRMSAKSRPAAPASPPAQKRSLMPVTIGAVVVLVGGGAWAILAKGANKTAGGGGSPVTDTTNRGSQGARRPSSPDSTHRAPTDGGGSERGKEGPVVNAAKASDALDSLTELVDARPQFARDSALVLYNAASVAPTDRALAAFVIANAYWKQGDRPRGCQWITRAKTLDPATPTYTTIAQGQCQ